MAKDNQNLFQPYVEFGKQLRRIRVSAKKTLLDVSEALECDLNELTQIENGRQGPSKELLTLLISHFKLSHAKANQLWQLAGYEERVFDPDKMLSGTKPGSGSDGLEVVVGGDGRQFWLGVSDNRILYTDAADVSFNSQNVVINFLQALDNANRPSSIARVGMSVDQAASLIKVLRASVDQALKHRAKHNKPDDDASGAGPKKT